MSTSSLLTLLFLPAILAAMAFYQFWWPAVRLQRIRSRPFPERWRAILERTLPFYPRLPPDLKNQLQDRIKEFLADKRFFGCGGQQINDDIRVSIAAWACLLLLNREASCYPGLNAVLVYPSTFVVTREHTDEAGVVSAHQAELLGESWARGKVVLAWDNVRNGIVDMEDGYNVVLHEFAHQLDHEDGADNGAPLLSNRAAYRRWSAVFTREYEALARRAERGEPSLLDYYGATDPAEFFAVATETFFELPHNMRERHPELYRELAGYYRVDPGVWH